MQLFISKIKSGVCVYKLKKKNKKKTKLKYAISKIQLNAFTLNFSRFKHTKFTKQRKQQWQQRQPVR